MGLEKCRMTFSWRRTVPRAVLQTDVPRAVLQTDAKNVPEVTEAS